MQQSILEAPPGNTERASTPGSWSTTREPWMDSVETMKDLQGWTDTFDPVVPRHGDL